MFYSTITMSKSRLCKLLGIELPVMQGGMQWLAKAEMAAAVCNAGGLGTISSTSFNNAKDLRDEIIKVRALTKSPFAVNISMLPTLAPDKLTLEFINVIVEERVPIVETAGRDPSDIIPLLKTNGAKIIHKVPAVRFAKKAEEVGADVISIVGFECGGHPGMDDITTLILIQKAVKCLTIPLIAGGGFVDGKGLVAALALGADGIVMGTRFLASKECIAHHLIKEWICSADERNTVLIQRSIQNAARVMENKQAKIILDLEKNNLTLQDILPHISGQRGKRMLEEGLLDYGTLAMGQSIGLIDSIESISDIFKDIKNQYQKTITRLNA